jgi:hypothetical protein
MPIEEDDQSRQARLGRELPTDGDNLMEIHELARRLRLPTNKFPIWSQRGSCATTCSHSGACALSGVTCSKIFRPSNAPAALRPSCNARWLRYVRRMLTCLRLPPSPIWPGNPRTKISSYKGGPRCLNVVVLRCDLLTSFNNVTTKHRRKTNTSKSTAAAIGKLINIAKRAGVSPEELAREMFRECQSLSRQFGN